MRFCRLDYEYYFDPKSGIGFHEDTKEQLRNLMFQLEGACRDEDKAHALCSVLPPSGPWEVRMDQREGYLSVGLVGTPRTLFSINPKALGGWPDIHKAVCSIIGMLNSLSMDHPVAYVERDQIPKYILDADDKEIHKAESYRRYGGWKE